MQTKLLKIGIHLKGKMALKHRQSEKVGRREGGWGEKESEQVSVPARAHLSNTQEGPGQIRVQELHAVTPLGWPLGNGASGNRAAELQPALCLGYCESQVATSLTLKLHIFISLDALVI